MLELPALQPPARALAQTLTELPFGSQTQIRLGSGQLSAFLAYAGCDRSVGTARYALRVLNNTRFTAQARLFVEVGGAQISAYPLSLEVAPFSMRDDIIPIRLDVTGPFDRALVHVTCDESSFTVEAPPPQRPRRAWWKAAVAAGFPLMFAGAAALAQPHVLDVSAPGKALAGSTLDVPYQVAGLGSVEYDLKTRDGLQLAAGLNDRSGVLRLQIPRDGAGSPYALHVRIANTFLKDERTQAIAAVIPHVARTTAKRSQPQPGALIDALSVSPSPAQAGSELSIKYATSAQSGDVWLVDAAGTTWARVPLSPDGSSTIPVPKPAAGRDLRVIVHAQRGTQHAESSVAISVLPSDTVASAPETRTPAPPAQTAAAPELHLSAQVVSAGDTVSATITGVRGDVRITMMSAAGTTVSEGDVGEGNSLTLNAPNVTSPATFFVVATLTNGVAQQSIMKRLVVTPR